MNSYEQFLNIHTYTLTTEVFHFRAYAFSQKVFQKTPILDSDINKIMAIAYLE